MHGISLLFIPSVSQTDRDGDVSDKFAFPEIKIVRMCDGGELKGVLELDLDPGPGLLDGAVESLVERIALGESLRREIREVCSLTCSVGLAPNRLLAKIASEEAKPDGLFETPFDPEGIARWLALKPVKTLWGVGKKTGEILNKYGFRTCGDIQRADPRFLSRIIGVAAAKQLIDDMSEYFGVNLLDHVLECVIETPMTIAHYTGAWNGCIYGYAHTMEDHIVARLQTAEAERFIEGLEFAGAHAISGDGMGPAVTNGRKAAKNVLDDIAAKEAKR